MTDQSQPDAAGSRIAFFISPHGFGHAARAASIMEALTAIDPSVRFDIFSTVPDWFFAHAGSFAFRYHYLLTDIGLIQKTPFKEDLPATVDRLKKFLPFEHARMAALAENLQQLGCKLVVCDIAPMGIRIAQEASLPSVLIENFTWDWLYQGYADKGLNKFNAYLDSIFAAATYHIQTEPVCRSGAVDLTAAPASRKIKIPSDMIRRKLGLPHSSKVVVITAGGVSKNYAFIDRLKDYSGVHFIVPGSVPSESIQGNLILLPENSAYFHPDLINAADAVIGKAGYSTIAEIYQAGVPFGYVARPDFRESKPLVDFIENHMQAMALGESDFQIGRFSGCLEKLLQMPRARGKRPNGADQIAGFIAARL